MHTTLLVTSYFSFAYFGLVNGTYLLLNLLAYLAMRMHQRRSALVEDRMLFRMAELLKPVSVMAPAYNEEVTVVSNVRSLLTLDYPTLEVIVINDGSSDSTLERLREEFKLVPISRAPVSQLATQRVKVVYGSLEVPNLLVIDKENGGKADALNTGLNYSRSALVTSIDTDSLLERGVLLKMVRPFIERPETVAVGGVVKIINGCSVRHGLVERIGLPRNPVALLQVVEYFRAFLFGRVGWAALDMLTIISGAFGMFQRKAVVDAGGYRHTVGEDMELVLRLHRTMRDRGQPYRIDFLPEPVCWTEVPESLAVLGKQRNRWHRGLLDCLWIHRAMLFNPRYGRIGLVALPFALIVEALGPFVEFFGLLLFFFSMYSGVINTPFALAFLAVAVMLGIVQSLSAILLEEVTSRRYPRLYMVGILFLTAIVENFGYRQLNLWWRIRGIVDYLRGDRAWGRMTRRGFAP